MMPCGAECGTLSVYSLTSLVFGSTRPSLLVICPVYQIEPSGAVAGSCGREPGVATGQSLIATCAGPSITLAAGLARSGKLLVKYSVSVAHSFCGTGTSRFCIMRTTVRQPSGVYPARARLMSWQAPQ